MVVGYKKYTHFMTTTHTHTLTHTHNVISSKVVQIDREGSSQTIVTLEVGAVGCQTSDILREESLVL